MSKCDNCIIMKQINNSAELSCCIWYMDNVVCGNKSIEECTDFKESEDTE